MDAVGPNCALIEKKTHLQHRADTYLQFAQLTDIICCHRLKNNNHHCLWVLLTGISSVRVGNHCYLNPLCSWFSMFRLVSQYPSIFCWKYQWLLSFVPFIFVSFNYRAKYTPLIVATSSLPSSDKLKLKQYLQRLGGHQVSIGYTYMPSLPPRIIN